jgi:hypothetical protein
MTANALYVRSRGKILGPFNLPQLQSLRDRGQLRRFHEVSEDRLSWVSASSVAELFPPGSPPALDSDSRAHGAQAAAPPNAPAGPPPEWWYYLDSGGRQCGPCTRRQLDELWQAGTLEDNSRVWKEGLGDWQAIADLPPEPEARPGPAGTGWRRVRLGVGLVLLSNYVWLAGAVLLGFSLLLVVFGGLGGASLARSPHEAGRYYSSIGVSVLLILVLGGLVKLASLVLQGTGQGLCMLAPARYGSALRPLAITSFALLMSAVVFSFVARVVGAAFYLPRDPVVWVTGGTLALLVYLIDFAAFVTFLFFLRSAALALGRKDLARGVVIYLLSLSGFIGCALVLLVFLVFLIGSEGLDLGWDEAGDLMKARAVGSFVLLVGAFLAICALALYGWFLVCLHQVRGAVQRYLTRC